MRQFWTRAIVSAAVATVTLVVPATPAHATISGEVDFVCTADLPVFPAAGGVGTCGFVGPVPGQAVVTVSGTDTQGHAYVAGGTGPFRAVFAYSQLCAAALPVPPPTGAATGTASVTGLTAVHEGAVMSARFDTNFAWTRVGSNAVFITTNSRISFSNGHVAVAVVNDFGTATFAPLPVPGNCAGPAPTRAIVAGTDHLVA